jgi:hypothetical protein
MPQPTAPSTISLSAPYAYAGGLLTDDQPPAAPATLAELTRLGTRQQLAPPQYGQCGPFSDPQHRALAIAAECGRVYRGGKADQSPVRVLIALARRGLLNLTAHPGPRAANWAYGRITDLGRRTLAWLDAETGRTIEPAASDADPFAMCRDSASAEFDAVAALFPC